MDKMREGFQRQARRMQENLQQSVGLSEKKDALQAVSHIEQRNQKMMSMVKNFRQNLQNTIRGNKRRSEESSLLQQLQVDAKEFEGSFSRDGIPILAEVFNLYSEALRIVLEEKNQRDQVIEENVIKVLTKYLDDEKALGRAKEKLSRTVTDVEISRKRKQSNHDDAKAREFQDNYDQLQTKLENTKDNVITDIFTLCSKETEIASVFKDLIEAQVDFHMMALEKLQNVLPNIDRKIACYRKRPVFGCHLEDHLRYSNRSIAVVLEVCCLALTQYGFNEKGLFRVNGNNNRIRRMKAAFDAHQIAPLTPELNEYLTEPHSICSVLKSYLRELPEPLMTHELHPEWMHVARLDSETRKSAIAELLPQLPEANRRNLAYLIRFLQMMLEYEEQTMMGAANLSIVFGPNLVDSGTGSESENMLGSKLVETLLTNADFFFPNYTFNFNAPLISNLNSCRVPVSSYDDLRSSDVQYGTAPVFPSTHQRGSASPQVTPARSRPRCPAPPPPGGILAPNALNSPVEEISTSLEHLNSVVSKSPSVASNDSMAEYGCSNTDTFDECSSDASMTRSLREPISRPSRPPPPRGAQRVPSPELVQQLSCTRPVSYMNAVDSAQQETIVPPPRRNAGSHAASVRSDENNHRTVVHLESDSIQGSAVKPPVPAKPKPDSRLNEITKL